MLPTRLIELHPLRWRLLRDAKPAEVLNRKAASSDEAALGRQPETAGVSRSEDLTRERRGKVRGTGAERVAVRKLPAHSLCLDG